MTSEVQKQGTEHTRDGSARAVRDVTLLLLASANIHILIWKSHIHTVVFMYVSVKIKCVIKKCTLLLSSTVHFFFPLLYSTTIQCIADIPWLGYPVFSHLPYQPPPFVSQYLSPSPFALSMATLVPALGVKPSICNHHLTRGMNLLLQTLVLQSPSLVMSLQPE